MLKIIIGEIQENTKLQDIQNYFMEMYKEDIHQEIIFPRHKTIKLSYTPISLDFNYIIAFTKYILKLSKKNNVYLYTNDATFLASISHVIEPLYEKPEIMYLYKNDKEIDLENEQNMFKKISTLLQSLENYSHSENTDKSLDIPKLKETVSKDNLIFAKFSNVAFQIYFNDEELGIIDFQRGNITIQPNIKFSKEIKLVYDEIDSIFNNLTPSDFDKERMHSNFLKPEKTKELLKIFLSDKIEFEENLFKIKIER